MTTAIWNVAIAVGGALGVLLLDPSDLVGLLWAMAGLGCVSTAGEWTDQSYIA